MGRDEETEIVIQGLTSNFRQFLQLLQYLPASKWDWLEIPTIKL